jgi:hypothetical protein
MKKAEKTEGGKGTTCFDSEQPKNNANNNGLKTLEQPHTQTRQSAAMKRSQQRCYYLRVFMQQ